MERPSTKVIQQPAAAGESTGLGQGAGLPGSIPGHITLLSFLVSLCLCVELADCFHSFVGLVTLQESLRPDEMILEYVLDELSSYCLHITHTSAAVTVLPAARKPIEHLVETYVADVRLKKSNAKLAKTFTPSWSGPSPD